MGCVQEGNVAWLTQPFPPIYIVTQQPWNFYQLHPVLLKNVELVYKSSQGGSVWTMLC